jgi:hypothetical protein
VRSQLIAWLMKHKLIKWLANYSRDVQSYRLHRPWLAVRYKTHTSSFNYLYLGNDNSDHPKCWPTTKWKRTTTLQTEAKYYVAKPFLENQYLLSCLYTEIFPFSFNTLKHWHFVSMLPFLSMVIVRAVSTPTLDWHKRRFLVLNWSGFCITIWTN